MNDPLGAANARAPRESSPIVNAPLFRKLIQTLPEDRRSVILDLGAARPRTVSLLGRFRCHLTIANVGGAIAAARDGPGDPDGEEGVRSLLPAPPGEPTDAVLCWDFLNYLGRSQLRALAACLAQRCRAGALVHALICYSDVLMPERPGQYAPVDEGSLENLCKAGPTRAAPRYSPEDLRLCMPDYQVEHARLLRNGMQEYLFKVAPGGTAGEPSLEPRGVRSLARQKEL